MTRTFAIGDPGEQLKEIYQIVLDAQLAVLEAAKPGVTGIQLDAVAETTSANTAMEKHLDTPLAMVSV